MVHLPTQPRAWYPCPRAQRGKYDKHPATLQILMVRVINIHPQRQWKT